MLSSDYLTSYKKSLQSRGSPLCIMCYDNANETLCHLITECSAISKDRTQFITEVSILCDSTKNKIDFNRIITNKEELCQFILDPSSMNLYYRVSSYDPLLSEFFQLSRNLCYIIDKKRHIAINEMAQRCIEDKR